MNALLTRILRRIDARVGSTSAEPEPSPKPVWSDPSGRRRGRVVRGLQGEGYFVIPVSYWEWDPSGDLVCSAVADDLHAPMFDIDHPVTLVSSAISTDDMSHLRVAGVDRKAVRRGLRRRVRRGTLPRESARTQREVLTRLIRQEGRFGDVDVYVPGPVRVIPSRTKGHFHLYLDGAPMSMKASRRLAFALGVVDKEYVKNSQGRWLVRVPDPAYW